MRIQQSPGLQVELKLPKLFRQTWQQKPVKLNVRWMNSFFFFNLVNNKELHQLSCREATQWDFTKCWFVIISWPATSVWLLLFLNPQEMCPSCRWSAYWDCCKLSWLCLRFSKGVSKRVPFLLPCTFVTGVTHLSRMAARQGRYPQFISPGRGSAKPPGVRESPARVSIKHEWHSEAVTLSHSEALWNSAEACQGKTTRTLVWIPHSRYSFILRPLPPFLAPICFFLLLSFTADQIHAR